MGQEGPTDADKNVVDRNEEARLYARDGNGNYVPVSLTPGGQVETAIVTEDGVRLTDSLESIGDDENRVKIYVDDGDGGVAPLATASLDESVDSTTVAQVEYVARALNSQGLDEFVSRVTDSSGAQIDPLTSDVTTSVANDSVRVASPNPLDVSAAEVDVDIATQTLARIIGELELEDAGGTGTYDNIRRRSNAIQISIENDQADLLKSGEQPFDVSAATVTVADDGAFSISSTPLDPALASNAGDELRVSSPNPLDVSAAEVDVDIATQSLAQLAANVEQIGGQAQSATDVANKAEQLADALQTAFAADDQLRVDIENNNAGTLPVEQQTPVGVEDSGGAQIDPLAQRDLPAGVDVRSGVVETIQNDAEYGTTHRATGVNDQTEAFTLVLQNPGGSGEDFLVDLDFTTGGEAYLDYSQDITIDTAGTSLTYLPENVMSGTTPALNAEVDGTYTINGGTLETILPGSTVTGGNPAKGGGKSSVSLALLNPGESVLYTVTNQSGSAADFAADVSVSRL